MLAASHPIRVGMSFVLVAAAASAPAWLTLWLSFDQGGNRPGTASVAAALLGGLLILRLLAAPDTVRRPSRLAAIGLAAFTLYILLAAASASWSGAEDLAVEEFCRGLVYVALLATMVTLPPESLPWVLRASAAVLVGIGVFALLTRLAPSLVTSIPSTTDSRLNIPLGYWNALALMLAIGFVLALHLACDDDEPLAVRSLATAALAPMAVALWCTQSRGGLGVAIFGAVVYLLVARPSGARATCLAAAGPLLVLAVACYLSVDVVGGQWRGARREATLLLAFVLIAAATGGWLRVWLIEALEQRRLPLPPLGRRRLSRRWAVAGGAVAVVLAVSGGAWLYAGFTGAGPASGWSDPRTRLISPYNNGRVDLWRAALHDAPQHALLGTGAGTFSWQWTRYRTSQSESSEAHSLYVEALGELGLVGLLLVVGGVIALGLAVWRSGGTRRPPPLKVAALVVGLMWALDAAVEWVWEIPAASVIAFGLVGAAAATGGVRLGGRTVRALAAALVLGAVAVPVAQAAAEQRMDAAKRAYNLRDCAAAIPATESAARIAPWRAEPSTLLALCAAREGDRLEALARLSQAQGRDPGDWRLLLDRAIIEGATGGDPRAAIVAAAAANPRDGVVRFLYSATVARPRREWSFIFGGAFPYVDGFVEMPIGRGDTCSGFDVGYWRWTTWTQQRCAPTSGGARWLGPTHRPFTTTTDLLQDLARER